MKITFKPLAATMPTKNMGLTYQNHDTSYISVAHTKVDRVHCKYKMSILV